MWWGESEQEWELLRSGKFDAELAAVREEGEHILFYAQLRYHAIQMGRKLGWAAYFYKDFYGYWPNRQWEKVPPMRPTENTMAMIEKRDRLFRFEMKMKRDREETLAKHQREEVGADEQQMGEGEIASELLESPTGAGSVFEGG